MSEEMKEPEEKDEFELPVGDTTDTQVPENEYDGDVIPVRTDSKREVVAEEPEAILPEHIDDPLPSAPVEANASNTNQPAAPAVPQPPVVTPVASSASIESKNSPGVLVMQWLTYAFWGWFVVAMLWLSSAVFGYFTAGANASPEVSAIAYALASVIVLLLIAGGLDIFYARKEPAHKTGAATVIMLIHTVLFALCGIGALITAVFAGISLLIGDYGTSDQGVRVALYTALVLIALYVALTMRTMFGKRAKFVVPTAWAVFIVAALVMIGFGIGGPAMQAAATKQDRLVESALPLLAVEINGYANDHDALPTTLDELNSSSTAVQSMLTQHLVTYTPNTKEPTSGGEIVQPLTVAPSDTTSSSYSGVTQSNRVFYYRLCVTYVSNFNTDLNYLNPNSKYSSTISTFTHPKGNVCYAVQTRYTY